MNIYVKVVKEYDGCFEVDKFYRLAHEDGTGVVLYDDNNSMYGIPKDCIEQGE